MALLGVGGIAILRARQLSSAAGVDDVGTLTALGHAASTFWAGSCFSLDTAGSTSAGAANASLATAGATAPANALGSRAQFGVKGAISDPVAALGGHVQPAIASLARETAGNDRTGLVAALFAASAIIGAALGALHPRHKVDAA